MKGTAVRGETRKNHKLTSKGGRGKAGATNFSKKDVVLKSATSSNQHVDGSSSTIGSSYQNVHMDASRKKSILSLFYESIFPKRDVVPKMIKLRLKTATLKLTKANLTTIRESFDAIDVDHSGTVDMKEVLDTLKEKQSPYTNELFRSFIGPRAINRISYEEYLLLIATYCMFAKDDILRFCFDTFDTDKSGTITANEYKVLCDVINNSEPDFPGNYKTALQMFDSNNDGVIDYNEFTTMERKFPMILFPAFRLQDSMQKYTLGENLWTKIIEQTVLEQRKLKYQDAHGGNGGHMFDTWSAWFWSHFSLSDRAVQNVVFLKEAADKHENEADWEVASGVTSAAQSRAVSYQSSNEKATSKGVIHTEQVRHQHSNGHGKGVLLSKDTMQVEATPPRKKTAATLLGDLPPIRRRSGVGPMTAITSEAAPAHRRGSGQHEAPRKAHESGGDTDGGASRQQRPHTSARTGHNVALTEDIKHGRDHHPHSTNVAKGDGVIKQSKQQHTADGDQRPPHSTISQMKGEPRSNTGSHVEEDDEGLEGIAVTQDHKSRTERSPHIKLVSGSAPVTPLTQAALQLHNSHSKDTPQPPHLSHHGKPGTTVVVCDFED